MKPARWLALTGSVGLAVSMVAMTGPAAMAATHPASHRMALRGSLAPAQARAHPDGSIAAASPVSFDLELALRNASGAQAFVRAVSSPGSAQYRHYLTDAQWTSRFGPTLASVAKAESWLRQEGFTVGSVAKDRLFVSAQGSALRVEHAFGVKLGYYKVNGHRVRLAKGTLTVPSSLAGAVSGTVGVNQYVNTTNLAQQGQTPATGPAVPLRSLRRPPGSAMPGRARRSGGRRSTPRTRVSCTSHTPIRCRMTSAATSRPSCAARTDSASPWPAATTARA